MEIGTTTPPEIIKIDGQDIVSRTLLALDNNDNGVLKAGNEVHDLMKERGVKDFYVVRNFKRYLGSTMPADEGENVAGKPADKFCEQFLSHLSTKLQRHFNVNRLSEDDFTTCVAHPSSWDEQKVDSLVNMLSKVGFPDIHPITEPMAAVYAALDESDAKFSDKSENYLVVDFGGGTLDVCVVEVGVLGRFAKVISRAGDAELGGREFDKIIETQYIRNTDIQLSRLTARDKTYIRDESEQQKILISENMAAGGNKFICVFNTPFQSKLPVTKEDIINWCKDAGIFDKYVSCIDKALAQSGLDISEIAKVILTGGSSQWWFFKEIFTSKEEQHSYGIDEKKVFLTQRPHTDVCIGCALHAGKAEDRHLIPGVWIKYRIGQYKHPQEGWTELQQLKAPALPGREAKKELKFLKELPLTKVLSSYRIEFRWFEGTDEHHLHEVEEPSGIVELYARSNTNLLKVLCAPVSWIAKKITEYSGNVVEEQDDTYKLYMQMEETAARKRYKLLMLDNKANAKQKQQKTCGEEKAKGMPDGTIREFDVIPGYTCSFPFFGIFSSRQKKNN